MKLPPLQLIMTASPVCVYGCAVVAHNTATDDPHRAEMLGVVSIVLLVCAVLVGVIIEIVLFYVMGKSLLFIVLGSVI